MYDVAIIDLGGQPDNVKQLQQRFPHGFVTRYLYNYNQTIARCILHARTTHLWIVSSSCDYSSFDFDWEPTPWESNQIHCWASGDQKYGDTFLIPVSEFFKQQPEKLEWFQDINYHAHGVDRLPWPLVVYHSKDLTQTILQTDFESEYSLFTNNHESTHT